MLLRHRGSFIPDIRDVQVIIFFIFVAVSVGAFVWFYYF